MVNHYYDGKSAERIRARAKKGRVRRGLWQLLAFWAAASSSIFLIHHFHLYRIRHIRISGAGALEAEVRSLMAPCLGRAMWQSGAGVLAERIGRQIPAIKECQAAILPWGSLWVRVALRRPVARVDDSGTKVIDEEGVCFCLPQGRGRHLPRLDLAGSSPEGRMRAITALLACAGPDSAWVLESRDQENIRLLLPGATVFLGNGRFEEKWARLREIMKNRPIFSAPCIIDLRFHNQAIVRKTV
jgi:cell division septal protein FtsQ